MGNRLHVATATGSMVAVLLLTAGCGSGGGSRSLRTVDSVRPAAADKAIGDGYGSDSGYGSGSGSGSGADPAAAAAPAASAKAGELAVREAPGIGGVVTDGSGATLYRFDKDTAEPSHSACEGACATTWPPVPADDAKVAAGIDAGLLGAVERPDGIRQLTLAGWPVYRYAKDTQAGDTKGEGVGGTWHALAPNGKKAIDNKTTDGKAPEKKGSALSVATDAKLGKLLVDSQGRTLYRFNKDSAWPMKFGCLDACLNTWKPAAPVDKAKVSDIPAGLVGSVKRPDGTQQLTIDCWPVYLFTGDTAPGQTNGHGKQGLWFAVDDAGKKIPAAS
ncbi:SCO0930 family lipoprotein [Streptomyces sp. NPDC059431]